MDAQQTWVSARARPGAARCLAAYLALTSVACGWPGATGCALRPGAAPAPRQTEVVPEVAARPAPGAGPIGCERIDRLVIEKRARLLLAHCADDTLVEMRIAVGRGDPEPKRVARDRRTPEGFYRVIGAPRPSRFHLFLPLDYPSLSDADAALRQERITRDEYARIVAAHARGEEPPGDTALGGGIGLHGRGEDWRDVDPRLDWTLGCIALSDADIEFVAARVEVGTPVEILP